MLNFASEIWLMQSITGLAHSAGLSPDDNVNTFFQNFRPFFAFQIHPFKRRRQFSNFARSGDHFGSQNGAKIELKPGRSPLSVLVCISTTEIARCLLNSLVVEHRKVCFPYRETTLFRKTPFPLPTNSEDDFRLILYTFWSPVNLAHSLYSGGMVVA